MDAREAGRFWDSNADAWTRLARAGHDVYRDAFNTPGFLAMLPDVQGLFGLDIGCGEGHNTRLVAARGARVVALDVSECFARHAFAAERGEPQGIVFNVASATALPFGDGVFDFATSFMCLMDVPDHESALREACRVLTPGGFLQFSICHPCFDTPHRRNLRDESGYTYAIEVGGYFDGIERVNEWLFSDAPPEARDGLPPFRVPVFYRTLGQWLNAVVDAGFGIERVEEPHADEEAIARYPTVQDSQVVGCFLHVRCRKPAGAS